MPSESKQTRNGLKTRGGGGRAGSEKAWFALDDLQLLLCWTVVLKLE